MRLTLLLEVDSAFRNYDGHVAVDVALSVLVEQRDGHVGVGYALDEGYTEYAWLHGLCVSRYMLVTLCDKRWWGRCRRRRERPQPYQVHLKGWERTHDAEHAHSRESCGVVPFSSSFFAGRLLNCLHHDVRSRLADAGSGVWMPAGWGSPLRTRGVCAWFCMLGLGMGSGRAGVAAPQGQAAGCYR